MMENHTIPAPYEGNEKYIFISYSHKDIDKVLPIIRKLMADGFRVWYDDGISPGTEWPEVIAQHLNNCELFVAFLSNSYTESLNCKREIDFAIRKKKTFLAVFLEETDLPLGVEMQISTVQSVDYYKTTPEYFFDRLYNSEVVKGSGCKMVPTEPLTDSVDKSGDEISSVENNIKSESENSANDSNSVNTTENKKEVSTNEKKKHKAVKIIIPIIVGVFLLIILGGVVIGIGAKRILNSYNANSDSKSIEFTDAVITDEDLLNASKGRTISYIELENCELEIQDKSVWKEVANADVLQVRISNCGITDDDAKAILENASGVIRLELPDNQITDASFLSLCPDVYSLDLSGNRIEDTSFLKDMQYRYINLSRNKIKSIEKYNYENVSEFYLDDNQLSNLDFMENAIHLQYISANNNQLDSIDGLKNCTILHSVNLAGNQIEDISALKLSKDKIHKLNLGQNKIKDIKDILPMPMLTNLCMDDNLLGTLSLEGSSTLNYLSARNNEIEELSGDFAELTYLDLAGNKLDGELNLSDYGKLKNVFLENNNITSVSVNASSYGYGNLSIYNNPISKFDLGAESTTADIYISYSSELNGIMDRKFCSHLYLLNCPYDQRVSFEKVWGTYSLQYPEEDELAEKVEEQRKSF